MRFITAIITAIITGIACTGTLWAQGVNLTEAALKDRCVKNELTMELAGKITIKQDGKDIAFPHKAEARHTYLERYLETGGVIADKSARHYTTAESVIRFNNDAGEKRSLREKRRFLVAQRLKDHVMAFSPNGVLTREEMELTEHFDTMAVAGLLPGKSIDIGKSWTVANTTVQALCDFEGLTSQNVEGTLESVSGNIAKLKFVGQAQGINLGAQVSVLINAKAEFDTKAERIVSLEWKESDTRQQGPITPALTADVTIKLTRTPIETPDELSDFALVKIPTTKTAPSELANVYHQDASKRFWLSYSREWHVVSPEDSPQLVLRHMDRGDFIAQATVTVWKKIDPAKVMTLDTFAEEMSKTPGWQAKNEIERKELDNLPKGHHKAYRVAASGELDGVATIQYFYLIVGTAGEQTIVTFSVEPKHAQRLGARDVEMIRELMFTEASVDAK